MSKQLYCLFILFFTLQNVSAQENRSVTGQGNNISNQEWGTTNALLKRVSPANYVDNVESPKLDETYGKPNPRVISNSLFAQNNLLNSEIGLSDFTWAFGQFIDHDLTFVADDQSEALDNIVVPQGDQFFTEGSVIPMLRSLKAEGTGIDPSNPRNYNNQVTSYLDGSAIYGSTLETANWLRTFEKGKLKVSDGNLLPWNTEDGEFNSQKVDDLAPEMDDPTNTLKFNFVAGDRRANENPLLLAFHTIFVREHNRLCDKIISLYPFWSDEVIYQTARRKNIAYLQHITYNEWLPAMGVSIPAYNGYNSKLKVEIFNEFSAAAFRFGHTLINSNIVRMKNDGHLIDRGSTTLKDAFFNPYMVILSGGIDPFVKGMATQVQQELDCKVIDDVRNFLFGGNGAPPLDLASININRGRERGLPDYNTVRSYFGLPTIPSFYELTKSHDESDLLTQTYGEISNLDPWVGMLAEVHMEEAMMGRLMQVILKNQFQLLRDGDRFYYANDPSFSSEDIRDVKKTTLRDIIMRNTSIKLMQSEVFKAQSHDEIPNGPKPIPVELDATISPTLVNSLINLNVFTNENSDITIQIISMNGSVIKEINKSILKGENQIYLTIDENMPHGLYNILLYNKSAYNILKFIKG